MAKMSSWIESFLLLVIKAAGVFFRALPFRLAMAIAGAVGWLAYYIAGKKRTVVYANLRTVFNGQKTPQQLRRISRSVFTNLTKSFVELLYLPKMKRLGFERFVTIQGQENIDNAMAKGKGAIFLAVHTGNWELGSITCSRCGYPYNIVANAHKTPRLDDLLNQYRTIFGAKVIEPGAATRDIIRSLHNNEIVCLVLDQGGKEGMPLEFVGKSASLSTGAIRLAMKYGTPVCPVRIVRDNSGHQWAKFYPALDLTKEDATEQDLMETMHRMTGIMQPFIYESPAEYMWFYKVFKYSNDANVLVLDDGRTGHLRQSQAAAEILQTALIGKGKNATEKTVTVEFKNPKMAKLFSLYAFFAQVLGFLCREEVLGFFLTKEAYQQLLSYKADFIISCGSTAGAINFFLGRCYGARTICVLKSGLISWERFNLVVAPEHDRPLVPLRKARLVLTKAALNLMTPAYMKAQSAALLNRYSHLKGNVRTKIGVLLGGDTKGVTFSEAQARTLIKQLKDAAAHFNADILLTTSRRTPAAVDAIVARELKNFERCALCIIANENNIPQAVGGIAGLSDFLIVSGESISMVSEAASSGKRTIVFPLNGSYRSNQPGNKYDRFVFSLNEGGFLLASSIKDLSMAMSDLMRNKFTFKNLDDRARVRQAFEAIL